MISRLAPLLAAALVIACAHEYDELIFRNTTVDSGLADAAGGAAGAGGTTACRAGELVCSGACVAADQDTRCGGCTNDCTAFGLVCIEGSCGCDSDGQCGQRGTCVVAEGRCECDGTQCQAGESCERSAGTAMCTCNGGPACDSGEQCCQNPAGCGATCQR